MTTRSLSRSAVAVAALALALSACGGPGQEQGPEPEQVTAASSDGGGTQAPASGSSDSTDEAETRDPETSDDADSSDDAAEAPAAGTLSITLDGKDTELTPDIVECHGEPETIRNVVIKMRDGLPLVKVTPGEFAMVKLQERGEPEKSSSTADISAEDGTVTFDSASIGDAVVDGTVTCL